ncbi:hypothetical protein Esti_002716 [Eimeria stiedai]
MAEEAASGQGLVRFWAFTPALDLLKLHKEAAEERGEQKGTEAATNNPFEGPVTVLLLGLADVHHILWTAQARNTEGGEAAEVHFILAEELPEAAARALLLLHILTDDSLSVRDRVALYIDVYANAFVKEQTALYVHRASLRLEDSRGVNSSSSSNSIKRGVGSRNGNGSISNSMSSSRSSSSNRSSISKSIRSISSSDGSSISSNMRSSSTSNSSSITNNTRSSSGSKAAARTI